MPVDTTYTAQRGDTLDKIAKRNGLDLKTLCEINSLKKNAALRQGQKIKLASLKPTAPIPDSKKARVADPPATYTVGKGETLPKIAKQAGMTVEALCRINGIKKNVALKPGQKLQLVAEPVSKASLTCATPALTAYRPQAATKAAEPTLSAAAPQTSVKSVPGVKPASSAKDVSQAKPAPASKTTSSAKGTPTGKSSSSSAAVTPALSKPSATSSKTQTPSKATAPAAKIASPSSAKIAPVATPKNSSSGSGKPSKDSPSVSSVKATDSAKPIKEVRRR